MSDTVTLREISPEDEGEVRTLAAPYGRDLFVLSASDSLDEATTSPNARPWYRAIYAGDQPVGFVMLSFNVPPGNPEYPWRYFLWKLLIDPRYQRRGYGHAAMALVMDVVGGSPGGTELFTSVYPGEGGPAPFYHSLGFESTGEWFDGEEVFRLALRSATQPPARAGVPSSGRRVATSAGKEASRQ